MPAVGNPRFLELLDEARELHIKKAAGYSGEGQDTWKNFREVERLGLTPYQGVLVRMLDKVSRIISVSKNPDNDQLKDETIRDTLMDLSTYSLIAICLKEEEQGGRGARLPQCTCRWAGNGKRCQYLVELNQTFCGDCSNRIHSNHV